MIPEYKAKTNLFVGAGLLLQVLGRFGIGPEAPEIGLVLILMGAVVFIYGCSTYAQGKGHSAALGFLGLLSCVGLLILVLLPDRHRDTKPVPRRRRRRKNVSWPERHQQETTKPKSGDIGRRYPAVRKLLAVTLHEDWPEEYESWQKAIESGPDLMGRTLVEEAAHQLAGFLTDYDVTALSEDQLELIVEYGFDAEIDPSVWDCTYAEWLHELADVLGKAAAKRPE